ncbi:hypothetical protein RWV98_15935 [Agathobaculum sp. NTUH-O15-33]|uniref:phage tail terminator family protein n=1 Tax=Agathobaculum sp. NTUH-O15-33 TaxID=3079302 RepID=UPI002958B8BE|nr:hypothetical protein [Agathobaculum sp. NTUH-O15-33]WNX84052.1 hypothetical protein RWV98_15935 [Agathobaculum sp. NTUH-O15-33]
MNITQKIADAIRTVYPAESCGLYTEEPETGFAKPCFVIAPIKGGAQPYPGERLLLEEQFAVRYYPGEMGPYAECVQAAQTLFGLLGVLPGVRAAAMNWEVTEGALYFTAAYSHFVRTAREAEPMDTLRQTQDVKA